ncbi:MAG: RDD family protein [Clostridiales bacterium]|nr:RDD family protein [Clostridiales bacterium]
MNYSNVGKRIAACLIDAIILNAAGIILFFMTNLWYIPFISLITGFLYYTIFEGGSWHATPGKRLFGMQVVDSNNFGIDYGKAAIRALCRMLSGAFLGIGYFIALFSDNHQTLHDKLADTFVVDTFGTVSGGQSTGSAVVGVTGEHAGVRFPVTGNGIMIGRDAISCQMVLRKTRGISRLHCFLSYNPASGMYILTDRNSKYGTFTDKGVRVTPHRSIALKRGERFYLASKDALFEVV